MPGDMGQRRFIHYIQFQTQANFISSSRVTVVEVSINNSLVVPTDLMPQHALQPVLSCSGDVDSECGSAVHDRHGGSGQEVIGHLDNYLSAQH